LGGLNGGGEIEATRRPRSNLLYEPKIDCDGERGDKKRGVVGVPTGVESQELCGETGRGKLCNRSGGGGIFFSDNERRRRRE